MPRGVSAFFFPRLGKRRGKSGGEGAFRKEVTKQIGNAKRGDENVGKFRRAEHEREDLLAHHAHQARAHHGGADDHGGTFVAFNAVHDEAPARNSRRS